MIYFCIHIVYLDVEPTTSSIKLAFNFGSSTVARTWNIKIALLPCGASYLGNNDT